LLTTFLISSLAALPLFGLVDLGQAMKAGAVMESLASIIGL